MTASNLTTDPISGFPARHFDPILDDYRFFEEQATEMENDLRAYTQQLVQLPSAQDRFRLMDFGAGTGSFTRALLWHSDLHHRVRLDLTLVEPGEKARGIAWDKLRYFTGRPVRLLPGLPTRAGSNYDLILSNHALYYVEDLHHTVETFVDLCGPNGKVLATMAGRDNFLVRLWYYGFSLIDELPPYYHAEHLEAILEQQELDYYRETIPYTITFQDSIENRMKILRFLFGSHLAGLPITALLDFFDSHTNNGRILIENAHYMYQF